MEIDLSKFSIDPGATHPYLKIEQKGGVFFIYEGAFGKRYRYFEVRGEGAAVEACRLFYEHYFLRDEHRFSFVEDGRDLLLLMDRENGVKKLSGQKAYLKYWDHFSVDEKRKQHFNVIPHFKALKEWYRLRFVDMIENSQRQFVNKEVKKAIILQWADKMIQDIEQYLHPPRPPVNFSVLTMAHARELNMFYKWVEKRHRRIPKLYHLRVAGKSIVTISNNAMIAAIIGGIIAGIVVLWLAKIWHF